MTQTRMQRYREALRHRGLRPIQIWVPDTRAAGFADAVHRQCLAANAADDDDGIMDWLENVSVLDDDTR